MLFRGVRLLSYDSLAVSGTTFQSNRIVSFSFSELHAVAVLANGEAVAIGSNSRGQLGTGLSADAAVLTLVRCPDKITSAFAGTDFTLFLTDSGAVLSAGLGGALCPVPCDVRAAQLAGCRQTVAAVTPDGRLLLWPDFRSPAPQSPALLARPRSVSCGVNFAAVLLENGLLVRADADGRTAILSARRGLPVAKFTAMRASDTYIAAVAEGGAAWLFGDFNGYAARVIAAEPIFESAIDVFAFPHYAIGITPGFEVFGVGRLPPVGQEEEGVFAKSATRILSGALTAYVAGNDREFVGLPLYFDHETARKIADVFVPAAVGAFLPVE
jgi:hypothetical protein